MLYAISTNCHYMCHNTPLSYILIQERGIRGVSENFELPKGKGRVILKFWIIFIVFTAPELHPDTLYFELFSFSSNPGNNVKTKNYKKILKILTFCKPPLSLKSLGRGSGHFKVDIHFSFLLSYYKASQKLKCFS